MGNIRTCGIGICAILTALLLWPVSTAQANYLFGKAESGARGSKKSANATLAGKGYKPQPLPKGEGKPSYGQLNAEYFRRLEEATLEGYLINPGKGGGSQGSDALLRDYVIAANIYMPTEETKPPLKATTLRRQLRRDYHKLIAQAVLESYRNAPGKNKITPLSDKLLSEAVTAACSYAGLSTASDTNIWMLGERVSKLATEHGSPPGVVILGAYLSAYGFSSGFQRNKTANELLPPAKDVQSVPPLLRAIYQLVLSRYGPEDIAVSHVREYLKIVLPIATETENQAVLDSIWHDIYYWHPRSYPLILAQHAASIREIGGKDYEWLALFLESRNKPRGSDEDIGSQQELELLSKSYQLRPDLPYAPGIAAGVSGISQQEARVWFDRAVAAQPDFHPAYTYFSRFKLQPRYGGSRDAQIAFAAECFAPEWSNSTIPLRGMRVLADLFSDNLSDNRYHYRDWRFVWREPAIRDRLLKVLDLMQEADEFPEERVLLSGLHFLVLLWNGMIREAADFRPDFSDEELMIRLNNDINAALGNINPLPLLEWAKIEFAAYSGKHGDAIIAGDSLLYAGDVEAGLGLWKDSLKVAHSDEPETAHYLRERAGMFMLEGGWGNYVFDISWPVTVFAAQSGNIGLMRWLLENRADPNQPAPGNLVPPVAHAVFSGNFKMVDLLVRHGANLNHAISAAADWGAQNNDGSMIKLLADAGVDLNFIGEDGHTAVVRAIRSIHRERTGDRVKGSTLLRVKMLIESGADVNAMSEKGHTPLYEACSIEELPLITYLIAKGADVNQMSYNNWTPLTRAIGTENLEVVDILLRNGADANLPANKGITPYARARQRNNEEIVALLLKHGATPDESSDPNSTQLLKAVKDRAAVSVRKLLEKDAKSNSQDTENIYAKALYNAVYDGNAEIVELLLQHGARHDIHINKGWLPLTLAAYNGNIEITKLLIQHGADVNATNRDGVTPLYAAAWKNHAEILRLLTASGANINLHNGINSTPVTAGVRDNSVAAVKALIELGADLNAATPDHESPLYAACRKGNFEMAKLLVENGAFVDRYIYENKWSELIIAAAYGHAEIVQLLLEHGADPERKVGKQTPLSVVKKGDERTIIILREAIARRKAAATAKISEDKNLSAEEAE